MREVDTMLANTSYVGPERRTRSGALRRMFVSEMTPEEMRIAMLTDELTGLPNRRAFQERTSQPGEMFLLMDACGLKYINDTYGLAAGDALLELVSGFLRRLASMYEGVQVFRLGGRSDEFLLVGPAAEEAERMLAFYQLNQELARLPLYWHSWQDLAGDTWRLRGVTVTWAVGQCLASADLALRTAKTLGEEQGTRPQRGECPLGLHVWRAAEVLR